jgi:subtilisin-like proprotein convertase family protein
MRKIPHFLIFILAMCFTAALFSQDWYGGQYTSNPVIDHNKVSIPGGGYETPSGRIQTGSNDSKIQNEPRTDEVGYFSNNAILTLAVGQWAAAGNIFNENFDGSAEAWIYPTSLPGTGTTIMSKGATSNKAFGWYITSAGQFTFRIGSTELVHAGTAITINTWTHVAVTWTGSGPYTVTFYVNGVQSGATMNQTGTWNINADSLRVGRDESFTSSQLNGSIDNVSYWSNPRTLAQIRDNRFVGLGDWPAANTGSALTSSSHYATLNDAWTFNTGSFCYDPFNTNSSMYYRGSTAFYANPQGVPIPYNYVVVCPFGANDYVTVPDNSVFNASAGGTVEAWVYPQGQTTTHMLISRGTTGFQFFWGIRASIGNKQAVNIGAGPQLQNSDGVAIPLNQWSHVAMTWVQSGGNYTCTFYVNGQQSGTPQTSATTWNSVSGTLRIGGWHGGTANNWNGKLDEVKFWNLPKSRDEIRQSMFCSPRGFSAGVTGLVGAWNFDGNLLEWSPSPAGDGSFNTGGTNNCRLSAFENETTSGAPSTTFISYITAINRTATPQPFPGGFALKTPFKPITDNATTWDTISLGGSGTVTSVELFLSIRHTFAADLDIVLRSPNGQTRDITSDNGGGGDNVLTFFVDGQSAVTNTAFLPPWSNLAGPEVAMGNMGSSSTNGNWIISVFDDAGGDVGVLQGWGIRLNGSVTGIEPISGNIPGRFNLFQNYPNPFNPVTNIKFDIPKDVNAKLVVYDILGREVKTLVNELTKAGQYEVQFDATNIASGTYFYRLEAGEFSDVKKFVVVK